MKELEYPFDAQKIMAQKIKLRRLLRSDGADRIEKKIAVLGGCTTSDISLVLELFLLNCGIQPLIYESEYNQFYQDAVFGNPKLEEFQPDIIYVCTCNRNIVEYPQICDSVERVDGLLQREMDRYRSVWTSLSERYQCPIIQNNFEMPFYRLMGNRDASDIHGRVNFLTRLNMEFYAYAQVHDDFYICDINYISADYGLKEWSDPYYWYMYKYAINVNAIPYLSFNVANIIKSIFGKNKKGFVLDLDNTLWGGAIGDEGIDGIEIGPEEAIGQAYLEFQNYLKACMQLGIILNVDSKNDYENAILGLNHPDGLLRPDDMVVIKANWEPKDRNFAGIADELDLLPESLVFVDDNPAERHIVEEQLPGVSAPEIGEVQDYVRVLDRCGFFETTAVSTDDANRNRMYKENARRARFESKYRDYRDYLLGLEMHAVIRAFEPIYYSRIAQLTNKSNQFNLTTKRYTREEIEKVANDSDFITLYGKLEDRFGDNGVVSLAVGHIIGCECHIELWVMSCRVLKRDMEYAMMDQFVSACHGRGIAKVIGYYCPTAKNGMVKGFYGLHGFHQVSGDEKGNTVWELAVPEYENRNGVIKVNGV